MASRKTAVIVGGSSGIGLAVAQALAARGEAVWVTSRDPKKAEAAAGAGGTRREDDRHRPCEAVIVTLGARGALAATQLVGYTEVAPTLVDRFTPEAAIVLYGGMARGPSYPGSTTVTAINGGVTGLTRTPAVELAPVRVNAIHPGFVSDSPHWAD